MLLAALATQARKGSPVAFTGEGKLVRRATGYERKTLKPRYPASGSRAARAELAAAIGAYQRATDFSDEAYSEVLPVRTLDFVAEPKHARIEGNVYTD